MSDLSIPASSDEPTPVSAAWIHALVMAIGYMLLSGALVMGSAATTHTEAATVSAMRRAELRKGLTFVVVTGIAMFGLNGVQMARIRAQQARLRRLDRALAVADRSTLAGTFATTVAHDINNGLAAAMGALEALALQVGPRGEQRELVDELDGALARIHDRNRRLFELGGARLLGEATAFDVSDTLRASTHLAMRHATIRESIVTLDAPERLPFRGREALVQRAVLSLILNAAEAAGPRSRVHLTLRLRDAEHVQLLVDDSGPGIPPALRLRILEPFFTSKPHGTGLGLASVVACASLHEGTVSIDDSPLGGARFSLVMRAVN